MEECLELFGRMLSESEDFMISIPEVNILFKEGPDFQSAALNSKIGEFCLDNCCEFLREDLSAASPSQREEAKGGALDEEKEGVARVVEALESKFWPNMRKKEGKKEESKEKRAEAKEEGKEQWEQWEDKDDDMFALMARMSEMRKK